ncbi:MAG: MBL fold metallo-hydrolase [Lachnospiraceae bacterium]|nr:MBL fold metallo-hydrolase [Lachnospiraceae bacterium]
MLKPYYPELAQWMENHKDCLTTYDMGPRVDPLLVYHTSPRIYSLMVPRPQKNGSPAGFWAYLSLGDEKAMLIDAGHGLGDLKSVVDSLIGERELIVVNTHFHGDHSLGFYQFPKVYCYKEEAPVLRERMYPGYFEEFCRHDMDPDYYQDGDVIPFHEYEVIPCENHHLFHLGPDHEVELIWMPGHTSGGACYLDKKNRALFCGDALSSTQSVKICSRQKPGKHQEYCTVSAYRSELSALAQRVSEYDGIYDGHALPGADAGVTLDLLAVCDNILNDPNDHYHEIRRRNGSICKEKSRGTASVMYVDASL